MQVTFNDDEIKVSNSTKDLLTNMEIKLFVDFPAGTFEVDSLKIVPLKLLQDKWDPHTFQHELEMVYSFFESIVWDGCVFHCRFYTPYIIYGVESLDFLQTLLKSCIEKNELDEKEIQFEFHVNLSLRQS